MPGILWLTGFPSLRLWSRLVVHFWASAVDGLSAGSDVAGSPNEPDPISALQAAYEHTVEATGQHDWQGTTTACGAQLHCAVRRRDTDTDTDIEGASGGTPSPVLYATNLGDSQVMVLRPSDKRIIYKTKEQWHWFDCPRQLGTNSPDTPRENAVLDVVDLREGDVVLAMTDGVIDNMWEHDILDTVLRAIHHWETNPLSKKDDGVDRSGGRNGGMTMAAQELVAAAKQVAMDPFAESPFMEHAIEEGLASAGGGNIPFKDLHGNLMISASWLRYV
ncbi:PP2Cc [Geosmithia morbida]|uniref:Protein phosphatase n=1 Tax=Geosmithia morbida TaxID=1094350 RepID=A0A9P5D2N2_9HYPO|nr:PP2Cc [Geosmithia morbida]KAF4124052.1 PP2Cc [Geosmithia morbida]